MKIIVEANGVDSISIFAVTDWENGTVVHEEGTGLADYNEKMTNVLVNIPEIDGILIMGPEKLIYELKPEEEIPNVEIIYEATDMIEGTEND